MFLFSSIVLCLSLSFHVPFHAALLEGGNTRSIIYIEGSKKEDGIYPGGFLLSLCVLFPLLWKTKLSFIVLC